MKSPEELFRAGETGEFVAGYQVAITDTLESQLSRLDRVAYRLGMIEGQFELMIAKLPLNAMNNQRKEIEAIRMHLKEVGKEFICKVEIKQKGTT